MLHNNNCFSVYIPRVKIATSLDNTKVRVELSNIGAVSRIDFVPIGKKQGFTEYITNNVITAFVHFHDLSDEGLKIKQFIDKGQSYKYYLKYTTTAYWLLLPVKNPIPDTFMNNAQIVENCRFLEKKVEELTETVTEFKKYIKEMVIANYTKDMYFSSYYPHNNPIDWRTLSTTDILINDEDEDLSTHSSMPELESITASEDEDREEDEDSIPDILSIDSK